MSDLFENLDLQMRKEADAKNPQSAILASQMETDKRFASFIASNGERAIIIQKELREIADKYASRYDVDPQMVFEATVSHLVESADLPDPENFWEQMGMGDKYKNKMRKKERSDEQLSEWAKKHMQHDPKAVLESTDERFKDDPKCDNCGSRAGVTDYGLGNFCSIECGQKYRDKMEKDSSYEMDIPEEDIDQLNMLNDILDAEDAEDYDTVQLLSKRYKETYGPITRAMLEKARNMDFAAPKEEDLSEPIRGEEYLMDALDDRYASVKQSVEYDPDPYEMGDMEMYERRMNKEDQRLEMEDSNRRGWESLTDEEKELHNLYHQWRDVLDETMNYNQYDKEEKMAQREALANDPEFMGAYNEWKKRMSDLSESDQQRLNWAFENLSNPIKTSSNIKQAGFVDMLKGMVSHSPVGMALNGAMNAARSFNNAPTPLKMLSPGPALAGMALNKLSPSSSPAAGGWQNLGPPQGLKPQAPGGMKPQGPGSFMQQFRGSTDVAGMIMAMDDDSLSREFEELSQAYEILTREDIGSELEEGIQEQVEGWLGLMWDQIQNRVSKESSNKRKWTEQERVSEMKKIQKAKADGVPHDEILNMMEEYRAQFGRNFSTDSRKEASDHYDSRFDEVWQEALIKLPEDRLKAMTDEEIEKVADVYKKEMMVEANNPADPTIFGGFHLDVQETNYDRLMQELAERQSLDSLDENTSMMAYASKQAALAEFLTIHEAALFPEWMRKEGETWQDLLWRTNRQTPDTMPGRNRTRQDDAELVRGQQGLDFIQQAQGQQPYDQFGEQETTEIPVQKAVPESLEYVGVPAEQAGGGRGIQERFQQHNEQALANKLVQLAQQFQKARKNADKDAIMEQMRQLITETKGRKYISSNISIERRLVDFYVSVGIPEKSASIFVESVGELAQLQQDAPGFPVAAPDPESMNVTKEIGGGEGEKYKNWDVADKQKSLGLEHQDFTDFGEPVREFVQPGGEAPYSENTNKKIDKDAEETDMNAKGVKQEDNAPKQSSKKKSNDKVTPEQGQQALDMIKKYYGSYLTAGYSEPKLIMDWDWYGETPTPSIVWEEGPYDWAIEYGGNHNRFPKGVYGEPWNGWALALVSDPNVDYSQEGSDDSEPMAYDPDIKAEYDMLMKEMRQSSVKKSDAFEDMMDFKRNEESGWGEETEWDWIYDRPKSGPAFFPGEMEDDDWTGAELMMDESVARQAAEYKDLAMKVYEYMNNPNRDSQGPSDEELKDLVHSYLMESLEMERRLNRQKTR